MDKEKWELAKDIHHLANIGVSLFNSKDGGVILQKVKKSSLDAEVKDNKILTLF